MREHDANIQLIATARLRLLDDPLEQTQRMTFSQKQQRSAEATLMRHGFARAQRATDFRDCRCMHGEGRYSCPICAVQDGRV